MGWQIGDRVLVDPVRYEDGKPDDRRHSVGRIQEYVAVTAEQLISLPDDVSFDDAAVSRSHGTAHRMMLTRSVTAGDLFDLGQVWSRNQRFTQQNVRCVSHAAVGTDEKCEQLRALGLMKLSTTPLLICEVLP